MYQSHFAFQKLLKWNKFKGFDQVQLHISEAIKGPLYLGLYFGRILLKAGLYLNKYDTTSYLRNEFHVVVMHIFFI